MLKMLVLSYVAHVSVAPSSFSVAGSGQWGVLATIGIRVTRPGRRQVIQCWVTICLPAVSDSSLALLGVWVAM